MLNLSIYLTFTVAMIAKMATAIGVLESLVHLEKSSILFTGTGVRKNKNKKGSRHIKVHYTDYPKRFINRINEVYVFSIKYRYSKGEVYVVKPV